MSTNLGHTVRWVARAVTIVTCMVTFGLVPRLARSAAPPEEDISVVSDLVLDGDVLDDHWRVEFRAGLTRGLARAGFRPLPPAADDCVDVSCLRQQAREAHAAAVVVASVTVRDRFYAVRLEAFEPTSAAGSTPAAIAVVEEECPICGPGEVTALLERVATVLGRKLPKHQESGQLTVRSVPVGATITVDDKMVGVSPMDIDLAPGQHRIVVTAPGYISRERTTSSVSKVRESWEPVLHKLDPIRTPRQRQLAAAGWASAGAGASTGIAAVVFLAVDRRPFPPSCGAEMLDADGDCRRIYRTLPHAGIMLGATVALVITSAILLSRSRKARPTPSRSGRNSARWPGRALPRTVVGLSW